MHARDVHAGALVHRAILQHARDAAAAFGALPAIGAEAAAIERFQRHDDAVLHPGEEIVDRLLAHA